MLKNCHFLLYLPPLSKLQTTPIWEYMDIEELGRASENHIQCNHVDNFSSEIRTMTQDSV